MSVSIDDLEPADHWLLDEWPFEQIETVLRGLETGMDACLKVCMSHHYSSGAYIDAKARWDTYLAAHDRIRTWAYSSVPYWIYDRWFPSEG